MAETTKFVLEGDVTLAYFTGEEDCKHVLIEDKETSDGPNRLAGAVVPLGLRRLESKIADELGFPSEVEFDAMFDKLDKLRQEGLRPVEGMPDGVRESVKLRITVEVL